MIQGRKVESFFAKVYIILGYYNQYHCLTMQDLIIFDFTNFNFIVSLLLCLICCSLIDEEERTTFMESISAAVGLMHEVTRNNIFEDVLALYKKGKIIDEYPIFIKYKDEMAVDDGGVQRDMYSAFWQEAYCTLFEGASTLIPMVYRQLGISVYPILGSIISHDYLASGILPERIALPTLLTILLGPGAHIPSQILMDAFLDYVSTTD